MPKILKIAFCFLFFLAFAFSARAAAPLDVVINEVAWMGTKMEGIESKNWWRYEWLELYNNTNNLVFLDGWKIELYRTALDWSLELKGSIPANGYFLIVSSDKIFPDYDLNYSNLGGKLNNNGQKIILKDAAGMIVDELDYSSGWFAGNNETKQTMEGKSRVRPGSDPLNWQTSQNPGGTPKAKNSEQKTTNNKQLTQTEVGPLLIQSEEKPKTYPSGIFINEILPNPKGSDAEEEWIVATKQLIHSPYL